MQKMLLIERSATLGHLLKRTLRSSGFQELECISSYEDGLWKLQESMNDTAYAAILLGSPARESGEFAEILDFLAGGPALNIPVVLLAHADSDYLGQWRTERGTSSLVLWTHFGRIPNALKSLLPDKGASATQSEKLQGWNVQILFVDDSQSVRFTFRQLLEAHGFKTDLASSIEEGEAMAKKKQYDLAIVDYFLGDGTGDELVAKLHLNDRKGELVTAIITGTYRESVIKKCLDSGALECMFKNEAKELFLARVKALARTIEIKKSANAERQRVKGILDSVGDGVYGVDNDGLITFMNPAGIRMLGFTSDEDVIGRPAHDSFHYAEEDGVMQMISESRLHLAYINGQSLSNFETVFWSTDNRALPVEISVVPMNILKQREGSVVVFRDISERKTADNLRWEASHDSTTNLYNRRHFNQRLAEELRRLKRHGGYDALLYIDLDRFTHITETLGEQEADRVLRDVAAKITGSLRDSDLSGRIEGDQFVLLLSGIQLDNIFTIADGYRNDLHQVTYRVDNQNRSVAGSIGVAVLSPQTASAEIALEEARKACQIAKRKGRDQTHISVQQGESAIIRELESGWGQRFKEAITNNRFTFLAQPIVGMDHIEIDQLPESGENIYTIQPHNDGQEFIFELLLRMHNRDGEIVSPAVFVPLAERIGVMQEIDMWVVRRLLRNLVALGEVEYPIAFTVNLSNTTLQDPEALGMIKDMIEVSKIDASKLIFEITETSAIENVHNARQFIQKLREHGIRFALDDFGTGFSSFSHLKHLPVDFVKIDGLFVETMADNSVDYTMVETITSMAHSLGLKAIAEHVDTRATAKALKNCGVDYMQGHYLSKPVPLKEINFRAFKGNSKAG
ncbi:MAG: two-component system response regulator [bacterium]